MSSGTDNTELQTLVVSILDKEYRVTCPPEEELELRQSARYLDGKMREIREKGRTLGSERIAIMAALNISYELTQKGKGDNTEVEFYREELQRLSQKVDSALE